MDLDLARTFLEIARTGSFMAAAENLHVTQTTVTARIHNLEARLGCRLFVRNRAGARLTVDGEHFRPYAAQLVQTWQAARRALPLPDGHTELLVIGAEASLAQPLLLAWASHLRRLQPNLALRIEVADGEQLQQHIEQGVVDAALVYQPTYWPGLQVEQVLEEKLVQVQARHGHEPYVLVDWGAVFRQQHDSALPDRVRSPLTFNLGPLALQYILRNGGRGYFRTRVVERHLAEGTLTRVAGAPEFTWPLFLVHARDNAHPALAALLAAARTAAGEDYDWRTVVD